MWFSRIGTLHTLGRIGASRAAATDGN